MNCRSGLRGGDEDQVAGAKELYEIQKVELRKDPDYIAFFPAE